LLFVVGRLLCGEYKAVRNSKTEEKIAKAVVKYLTIGFRRD
jgi:hypothetical protein